MKELYTWADPVYIWLGAGNARAYRAIDYLSRTSRCFLGLDFEQKYYHGASLLEHYSYRPQRSQGWLPISRLVPRTFVYWCQLSLRGEIPYLDLIAMCPLKCNVNE